jgi:hypothetical protein
MAGIPHGPDPRHHDAVRAEHQAQAYQRERTRRHYGLRASRLFTVLAFFVVVALAAFAVWWIAG